MTKQEIHQAFLDTTYKVFAKPNFIIKINKVIAETQHLNSWAFITAWNPLPKILTIEQNRQRNRQLEDDLIKLDLKYCTSIGISEDDKWSEESFFIENISVPKANQLAVKYGQLAFVFGQKNEVAELIYSDFT
uniref:DUF3293 domain-containing protein n=1 Tax=Flavobacterium sp. TaxID=239 RepID=UPI0040494B10